MALVRWADDSQLYMMQVRDGIVECHLCPFVPHGSAVLHYRKVVPHIQAHRHAGHRVPDWLTDEFVLSELLAWQEEDGTPWLKC